MSDTCALVIGATLDGRRVVTCGAPLPCAEHPSGSAAKAGSQEARHFALHAMRCGGPGCEVYDEYLTDFVRAVRQ